MTVSQCDTSPGLPPQPGGLDGCCLPRLTPSDQEEGLPRLSSKHEVIPSARHCSPAMSRSQGHNQFERDPHHSPQGGATYSTNVTTAGCHNNLDYRLIYNVYTVLCILYLKQYLYSICQSKYFTAGSRQRKRPAHFSRKRLQTDKSYF